MRAAFRLVLRLLGCLVVLAGAGFALTASATSAAASSSDLSVTYPPDPIPVVPGSRTSFKLLVTNIGPAPLTVGVTAHQVVLADNGRTRFASGPDPRFSSGTTIEPEQFTLAPGHRRDVLVTVLVPKSLTPDDYFLGWLVSPVLTSPAVAAVNEVGALVVLDVPGPRDPRLSATFVGLPSFKLSGTADGYVQVTSTGTSTVSFTTDTEVSGFVHPSSSVIEEPPRLLPPTLTRDIPVSFSSWLGLGWYTVHSTIVYNVTAQRTGEVALSSTVILIAPYWLALPVLVFAIVAVVAIRRRRRRARAVKMHSVRTARRAHRVA